MNWNISAAEFNQLRKTAPDSFKLIDVREPEEFQEVKIEGATLIPLDEISQRGPRELKVDDKIILYCAHGVRSMHALMALRQLGFKNLRSLEGGIFAWLEQSEASPKSS